MQRVGFLMGRQAAFPRLLAFLIALGAASALPPGAPTAAAQTVQSGGDVRDVVVRGNRRIEVETILAYMQLSPDQQITAEDLNAAVRRLFDTGLFRDVRIVPEGGVLIVEVEENPSINQIAFEGNDFLSDEDLRSIVSMRPRFPFTPSVAERDAQSIIEIYRRTGRYGAEVEPVLIERPENRVDVVFEIDEGEMTGINSISFTGNEVFSDSRLRDEIDTTETGILSFLISTDVFDPDRLELDKSLLRQFYLSRGYADFTILSATAELSPDREGFFITFNVDEGEQYTFGEFDVIVNAEGLEREDFLGLVPSEDLTGEVYNADTVEEIANDLTDLAGEQGFAFVRVRPIADKDTENRVIGITFELIEGNRIFIERIDIEGNTLTLDRVIRREIELVEGDAFDARKIRRARREIRALDFFRRVEIDTEEGSADDRAVLTVTVEEKSTGSITFGAGFSSSVGPIGNIAITERNFLGRGQTVRAQVTAAGDTQIYDFTFVEPRFLDRDLAVGLRAFFTQDDRSDESSFELNRGGFEPSVGFPLSERSRLTLTGSFSRDDLQAAPDASPAIQIDDGARLKSSLGYALTYDQRNDPVEPTGGYFAQVSQEFAGLGGDARFVSSRGSVKGWQGFLGDDIVASVELEAGAIFSFTEDTQVNDRFFLGSDSFRGFASEGIGPRDLNTDDAVGGNFFGIARAQVSFPLGLPEELGIFGGLFVDVGSLWGLDRTTFPAINQAPGVTIDDGLQLRAAAGGLLFINSPLGPVEISIGFPVLEEDFDESEIFRLSVGTRF